MGCEFERGSWGWNILSFGLRCGWDGVMLPALDGLDGSESGMFEDVFGCCLVGELGWLTERDV